MRWGVRSVREDEPVNQAAARQGKNVCGLSLCGDGAVIQAAAWWAVRACMRACVRACVRACRSIWLATRLELPIL
eukprot:364359-Chlamydomonas_euryale.AAC.4